MSEHQVRLSEQPFYRFWRGVKRLDVPREDFLKTLGSTFIPATPKTHAKNGLLSYQVAMPGGDGGENLLDEIALLAYESKDVYDAAKATPEGRAYSDLHWTIFEKGLSRSVVPLSFKGTNPATIEVDTAYDMLEKPINWQSGVTGIFLGTRRADVAHGSEDGALIAADGASFMDTRMWKITAPFAGEAADGDAFNVPFEIRKSPNKNDAWKPANHLDSRTN